MNIQNQIIICLFIIIVLIIGRICGYSEKNIMKLVKWFIGFECMTFVIVIIDTLQVVINLFTKN